ncbi:MAG: hypothetical protein LBQ60_05920 [Bacteroidales bacterium]|nr:hypothetical protein [Bacteroidales bacterium]
MGVTDYLNALAVEIEAFGVAAFAHLDALSAGGTVDGVLDGTERSRFGAGVTVAAIHGNVPVVSRWKGKHAHAGGLRITGQLKLLHPLLETALDGGGIALRMQTGQQKEKNDTAGTYTYLLTS